jgi:hypothetical protein
MKTVKTGAELGKVLKGLSQLCGDDFADVLKKLTFDGYKFLIQRTAVDSGYARSHWEVAVDAKPKEGTHKGSSKQTYSPKPLISVNVQAGSFVVLYNNTEYVGFLEHGTPKMRAQPMVAPTRVQLEAVALKLSKLLTKKVYDV